MIDSAGRIDKFRARYGGGEEEKKEESKKKEKAEAEDKE